ncbi:uncharacterized protein LOC122245546 [Penaeus japonicus]|uniref:uncharacterized protein LOC122245546 n=1 Tax=Penaeus japonicus TaxID=27405 RepID=UPI001C710A07|nr:uncharacterized protein LOC122245546 [Penaeus japonicus]
MSANEPPHTEQNGHAPSRPRDLHRLSQNIHQSLMQWYHRQLLRHDERQQVQHQSQSQQQYPQQHQVFSQQQVFPQQHQSCFPGQQAPQQNQFQQVQQPIVTYHVVRRPRNSLRRGILNKLPPYLQRGTTVCCGCRMSGVSILPLFLLGSILVFIGIFVLTSGSSGTSSFLMMAGFVLVLFYVWLCRKARKEYEALPQDHPERLYYANPQRHHVRIFDSSQLPPGTQMVHFSPTPPMHTQVVQLSPVSRTGLPPEAQMGHYPTPPDTPQRLGGSSRAPPYDSLRPYDDDDKPPAYEDLYKDI